MEKQAQNYATVSYYMDALDTELDELITALEEKWADERAQDQAA